MLNRDLIQTFKVIGRKNREFPFLLCTYLYVLCATLDLLLPMSLSGKRSCYLPLCWLGKQGKVSLLSDSMSFLSTLLFVFLAVYSITFSGTGQYLCPYSFSSVFTCLSYSGWMRIADSKRLLLWHFIIFVFSLHESFVFTPAVSPENQMTKEKPIFALFNSIASHKQGEKS